MKNLAAVLIVFLLVACRKEHVTTDPGATLSTNVDTLRFDTVFTTTRAITQTIKIFNTNNAGIRIDAIHLIGGTASPFKINVNGAPGPLVENIDIPANDSTYVFVTVVLPQSGSNTPFIVQDSIEVSYNNNVKKVQVKAYGQNAHFMRNYTVATDETWTADLPYVVQGKLVVGEQAQLTIKEGCRIFAHADAVFEVAGSLQVQGQQWDSTKVVFTGDRLDAPYRELPGSWPGIIFKPTSHHNGLQHAVIKNAYQAVVIDASPVTEKLQLRQTIIDNALDAGIVATNSQFDAENILVSNCGKAIVLQGGGTYNITHATVAAYSTVYLPHQAPLLLVSNGTLADSHPLQAVFRNCIFWGESNGLVQNELVISQTGTAALGVLFDGVLWPPGTNVAPASVSIPPIEQDPEFNAIDPENRNFDFHLKESSPARAVGVPAGVSLDIDGHPRPANKPDLGAYQQ